MGQLLFKKMYFDAIRAGRKTTTLRRWARPMVRAGQRAWCPGLGYLSITTIEQVGSLDNLSDADATADGFESAAAMRAALASLYPDAAAAVDGKAWYRVGFGVVEEEIRNDETRINDDV